MGTQLEDALSLHLLLQQRGHGGWIGPTSSVLGHLPTTSLTRGGQPSRSCLEDEQTGFWAGARKGRSPPGRCYRAAPLPSCYGRPRALHWGGPHRPVLSWPSFCWVQCHLPVEKEVCGMAAGLGASLHPACSYPTSYLEKTTTTLRFPPPI